MSALELYCVDRLYLNAYVPKLQVAGQVATFLGDHLGFPVPSPSLMEKIGNRFRRDVKAFAGRRHIPILALKKPDRSRWDDRKLDHVRPYLEAAEAKRRPGVVAIVAAQEFQSVFTAKNRSTKPGVVSFEFVKEERRVGIYYFYIYDAQFGPGFIKVCTYFPYPAKVWLNGHEWAKRQARREQGIAFSRAGQRLRLVRATRAALQAICDRFGPADVQGFFDRWTAVIPTPSHRRPTRAPATSGSCPCARSRCRRTIVFDDPRRARGLLRGARHRQHRCRPPRGGPGRVRSHQARAPDRPCRRKPGSSARGPR